MGFLLRSSRHAFLFLFRSTSPSSQPQPQNSKNCYSSGRCRYVPILGLMGVLLCLAGLAIYAGGAVPAGRTIAELVSKVDTKTSAAAASGTDGEGGSAPPPRAAGGGPLSRLVGAYVATTAVSSFSFTPGSF